MKIAVCFSGETRVFNQGHIHQGWLTLKNKLEQDEYTRLDFFGHTWEHCEKPESFLNFTKLEITDQVEIDNFVKEDLVYRSVNKEEWQDKLDFKTLSNDEQVKHYLDMSRRGYGQLVSAIKSFQLVPNDSEYLFIIRTRWDVELFDDYIDYFVELLENIQNKVWPFTHENEDLYLMNTSVIRFDNKKYNAPEDFLFIMRNRQKLRDAIFANPYEVIDQIITHNFPEKSTVTSHGLWHCYFRESRFVALPMIDHNLAKIYRKHKKENVWSI